MSKQKQPFNPFYLVLILVGVAFTITACAYTVMMFRATRFTGRESAGEPSGLMSMLDERGMEILGIEVLLLGLATVGAIGLDQYRSNREAARRAPAGTTNEESNH